MKSTTKSSLTELIKTGDFGNFADQILDKFNDSIIESFVDGFTESLFSADGIVAKFFNKTFQDQLIFGGALGEAARGKDVTENLQIATGTFAKPITDHLGNPSQVAGEKGLFGGLFDKIKGIFSPKPQTNPLAMPADKINQAADKFLLAVDRLNGSPPEIKDLKEKSGLSIFDKPGATQDEILRGQEEGFDVTGWEGAVTKPKDLTKDLETSMNGITKSFTDIFKNLGKSFSDIFGNITKMFSSGGGSSSGGFSGILSSIGGFFGGSSGISTGSGQNWLGSIASVFGFAEGGLLQGAGTGISDSIPAMLSNGEFVVNAKATREHLALLTRINSNNLPKFAEGGMVGSLDKPSFNNAKPIKPTADERPNQMFNINITGDVSRQTRSEVEKMIPQLANGISAYQRERGSRG
jgi:hypothetical protein